MKKIGIMTFHRAHNYGAVLQAYALNKTIQNLGYDVGFVDIQHPNIAEGYRLVPTINNNKILFTFKGYIHFLLDPLRKIKRSKGFDNFIKCNFSLISVGEKEKTLDVVVLGSDQIWNPEYTNGFVDFHFGKIRGVKSKSIISYAASMGKTVLDQEQKQTFHKLVDDIDILGVREQSLQTLLSEEFKTKSTLNLDPTLLLDCKDWNCITKPVTLKDEEYILVYEVQQNDLTSYAVEEISKKLGLKVVYLAAKTNFRIPADHISDASPEQFLYLFNHAKFVVTTSFHGTVFSIINNVPFVTIGFGNDIDARSLSVLEILNLEKRIVFTKDDIINLTDFLDVNFDLSNKLLTDFKKLSIDYLQSSLNE
ncbi:polysaccharide pyruvyl transferase family protein [Photobacterium leiognathi]|uniref:polysaccharide pyruvyl transferase family protein n=1 Tax=Photobacterium leiognathi TaxID=553611 RepID=UPI0029824E3A|nr:polysaccharide pyruvyl transferase family protein [Photobacterium leiognathi]